MIHTPLRAFFLAAVAFVQSAMAADQSIAVADKGVPAGLSVIVDASESMCGYYSPEGRQTVLALVRKGVVLTDQDAGSRLFLLKQTASRSVDAAHDIVEAPKNLQALAENMRGASERGGAACQPFNGAGSNLELIFDPKSVTRHSHTMVLVTDAQLGEAAREKFLDGFTAWAMKATTSGETPSAGFAVSSVPFKGRYFPEADPDPKRRERGYALPEHDRPLFVFWFADSEKFIPAIREFIDILAPVAAQAEGKAAVQHLLPVLATGGGLFTQKWQAQPTLEQLVSVNFGPLSMYDKSRSDRTVRACISPPKVSGNRIEILANKVCGDGKPFFDGFSSMDVTIVGTGNIYIKTSVIAADGESKKPEFRISPQTVGKPVAFQLRGVLAEGTSQTASMRERSVNSDFCRPVAGAKAGVADEACLARLQGKTFQADVLADQLIHRQQRIVGDLLVPLNKAQYSFVFTVKNR